MTLHWILRSLCSCKLYIRENLSARNSLKTYAEENKERIPNFLFMVSVIPETSMFFHVGSVRHHYILIITALLLKLITIGFFSLHPKFSQLKQITTKIKNRIKMNSSTSLKYWLQKLNDSATPFLISYFDGLVRRYMGGQLMRQDSKL